jgi:imidazole glycerol-phosphate synthase subunit HisH
VATNIVVVDYGSGNTFSITSALRIVAGSNQEVVLSRDPAVIEKADRVVLPGVGAFAACRRRLDESGTLESMTAAVRAGRPFLGVCVGMQILANEGREFGVTAGLGWIPGVTDRLPADSPAGSVKLPHVGWSRIDVLDRSLLGDVGPDDYFYFVHSYALRCADPAHVAATADYGTTFAAAVRKENVFGCQFHPEKSAHSGLKILEGFCRWKP